MQLEIATPSPASDIPSLFSEHVTVLQGFGRFGTLVLTESRLRVLDWPKWARVLGHVGLGVFIIHFVNKWFGRSRFNEVCSFELDESFSFRKGTFGFNPNILEVQSAGQTVKIAVGHFPQWEKKLNAALGRARRSA